METQQQAAQQGTKDLAESLWQEQMDQLAVKNPALTEYLNGEDEFGEKRMDKLTGQEDHAKRMQSLRKVSSAFQQGQAATAHSNATPAIPKKVQEAADQNNKVHTDLDAQLKEGKINPQEFAASTFEAMDAEGLFDSI